MKKLLLNKNDFYKLDGVLFYAWFILLYVDLLYLFSWKLKCVNKTDSKLKLLHEAEVDCWFNDPWWDWGSDYPNLSEPMHIFHRLVSLMAVVSSSNLCPRSKSVKNLVFTLFIHWDYGQITIATLNLSKPVKKFELSRYIMYLHSILQRKQNKG